MLQKDGAVTQIFGNHLFIQGRVEDETGIFRTSLRLQGNRWFGSCTAEDELIAGACQYATMMERMHRGEDLPESPNEFDDTPVLDIIEEKLGRELDDKEADFVTKIEKRYRRYVIEGELHDHDMVRITPRWEITTYEPLELWPMPPGDILEFWNYIAYAFYKKKLPYPEFMSVITDLGHVQKKMADWEQEREVASWYDRIEQVNERPPQDAPLTVAFRLVATINEARIEVKEEKAGVWFQLREKNDIENYVNLHHEAALLMDASSQTLWEHYLAFYRKYGDTTLDFDQEESCRFMNRVFRQPALTGYIVNLDERPFKVVEERLAWVCEDDPYDAKSFALQLVTASGENVSHSVRLLPGRQIRIAREQAPQTLVSYANYPSTEYLVPRNADFLAVNVYLEDRATFAKYALRLQNLAGAKPLVIAEFDGMEDAYRSGGAVGARMPSAGDPQGVQVAGIALGDANGRLTYEPDNPLADANGYVRHFYNGTQLTTLDTQTDLNTSFTALASWFAEKLNASIVGNGSVVASGSFSLLAAGA